MNWIKTQRTDFPWFERERERKNCSHTSTEPQGCERSNLIKIKDLIDSSINRILSHIKFPPCLKGWHHSQNLKALSYSTLRPKNNDRFVSSCGRTERGSHTFGCGAITSTNKYKACFTAPPHSKKKKKKSEKKQTKRPLQTKDTIPDWSNGVTGKLRKGHQKKNPDVNKDVFIKLKITSVCV